MLWHRRLGQVPFHKISETVSHCVPHFNCTTNSIQCEIHPLARQTRLNSPDTISTSDLVFDLVHADIWGPYKVPTPTYSRYFLTLVEDKSRTIWFTLWLINVKHLIIL